MNTLRSHNAASLEAALRWYSKATPEALLEDQGSLARCAIAFVNRPNLHCHVVSEPSGEPWCEKCNRPTTRCVCKKCNKCNDTGWIVDPGDYNCEGMSKCACRIAHEREWGIHALNINNLVIDSEPVSKLPPPKADPWDRLGAVEDD